MITKKQYFQKLKESDGMLIRFFMWLKKKNEKEEDMQESRENEGD